MKKVTATKGAGRASDCESSAALGAANAARAGDQVVGHTRLSEAAPTATPWRLTLAYGQHTRTQGYGATSRGCLAGVRQELEWGKNGPPRKGPGVSSEPRASHARLGAKEAKTP
jgi:hypothetical protein